MTKWNSELATKTDSEDSLVPLLLSFLILASGFMLISFPVQEEKNLCPEASREEDLAFLPTEQMGLNSSASHWKAFLCIWN